jgi:aspartyl-tRNA(Asn)/glutamyl-tRNA(Gln) amidotransferase subunit C
MSAMAESGFDIQYVARLARLALTPEEAAQFGAQLGHVLGYMAQLAAVHVEGVEPTAHAMPLANVTRPDAVAPSLPHEEAMRNAPAQSGGLFLVPKIVE